MTYILTAGWEDGVAKLTETIIKSLAEGRKTLWLVCGGSNIPAAVQVMNSVSEDLSSGLTIGLTDERYGPVGHKDSNWQQLLNAGFETKRASILSVLDPVADLETTTKRYAKQLDEALAQTDTVIGQLGIGEDGHTAGILPDSPATSETSAIVASYKAQPFTRITMTFPALSKLGMAYIFAFGATKRKVLEQLRDEDLDPVDQPAQILKQLPTVYIYNDQIGEHA